MNIKLASGIEIGNGCQTFIVAEVGSNWQTLDDCLHSINMAKACGADAVKFQLFSSNALYGIVPPKHYLDGVMDPHWIPKLAEHAKAMGIEFMCSAFSPELIDVVDPYINVHKVASAELTHIRMLEKLRAIGKPVILSTGASGDGDITQALKVLGETPVILLYCIAAYPARTIRLEHIDELRTQFGKETGLSDHSTDIFTIPSEAIFQHRACVLEKHFTVIPGVDTPDRPHSLTVDEFKLMVMRARNDRALKHRSSSEETDMITKHNRRLIATKTIQVGETLQEGVNFGIYRSLIEDTKALSPWLINEVVGRKSKSVIQAGHGIGPGDVL